MLALGLVRLDRVIPCITAMVLAACSSSPPIGRIQARDDDDDEREEEVSPAPRTRPPMQAVDAGVDEAADASPDADLPPPAPPASDPKPAPPIGMACQPGDAIEQQGEITPFTKGACGELKDSGDEDFYALPVPAARTVTLRIGAAADAVARLETPNGNVIVVSNGATGSVGSASGTAMIRVRSKSGTPQTYRIVAD